MRYKIRIGKQYFDTPQYVTGLTPELVVGTGKPVFWAKRSEANKKLNAVLIDYPSAEIERDYEDDI